MITKIADFLLEKKKINENTDLNVQDVQTEEPAVQDVQTDDLVQTELTPEEKIVKIKTMLDELLQELDITSKDDVYEFLSTKQNFIKEGFLDKLTGVKTYKLDASFKPSKEAETFISQRKDTEKKIVSEFMSKLGMDEATAKIGALAMATFTNGAIILLDKYNLTFNPETKDLKVDPNGKGILSAKVF